MCRSSSSHATAPTAASSSPHSARCARLTAALATSAVIPWPMAAGVFGIARTTAASAPKPAADLARASFPPRSKGTRRPRAAAARAPRQHVRELIRLDRENDDVGARGAATSSSCRDAERRGDGARGRHGIHDSNAARGAALREPAAHERLPHVAEPDNEDRSIGAQRRAPFSLEPHDSRCLAPPRPQCRSDWHSRRPFAMMRAGQRASRSDC